MTKDEARKILQEYIDVYGEIPSVFDDLRLAKVLILLKDEIEDWVE